MLNECDNYALVFQNNENISLNDDFLLVNGSNNI